MDVLLLFALCAVAISMERQAASIGIADWLATEPRFHITEWMEARQSCSVLEWRVMHERLARAEKLTPDNPVLHDYLASLYALRGRAEWNDDSQRRSFFLEARAEQEKSLALRPGDARTRASLAFSQHALGEPVSVWIEAWKKAQVAGPHDPKVQAILMDILLAHWQEAPKELLAWGHWLHDSSTPQRQHAIRLKAASAGLEAVFGTDN